MYKLCTSCFIQSVKCHSKSNSIVTEEQVSWKNELWRGVVQLSIDKPVLSEVKKINIRALLGLRKAFGICEIYSLDIKMRKILTSIGNLHWNSDIYRRDKGSWVLRWKQTTFESRIVSDSTCSTPAARINTLLFRWKGKKIISYVLELSFSGSTLFPIPSK